MQKTVRAPSLPAPPAASVQILPIASVQTLHATSLHANPTNPAGASRTDVACNVSTRAPPSAHKKKAPQVNLQGFDLF